MAIDLPPDLPTACVFQAAKDYQIPPSILYAIRAVEGGKVGDCGLNTDGTTDCGIMRINSKWVERFNRQEGLTSQAIANNVCVSVRCAAYVVRFGINRRGEFWRGVGDFHSRTPSKNALYVSQVAPLAYAFESKLRQLGWVK